MKAEVWRRKQLNELYKKTWDLIRSIVNNAENYVEKYMKIKFNSDGDLSLKKALKLYNMVIIARSVFNDG